MTGPQAVMAVILLETAVGGTIVLWGTGVWGVVRRGLFRLVGVVVTAAALGGWWLIRTEPAGFDATAAPLVIGVFAGLLVVWQVLLFVRWGGAAAYGLAAAKTVGLAAAVVGPVGLIALGLARDTAPLLAVAELLLGALFLGSALVGLLLGHWYLVERRLSATYMQREVAFYIAGVAAGLAAAGLSAANPAPALGEGFSPMLSVPGFSVMLAFGLVGICALIAGFVYKLAQEGGRSIQAATGMFYLGLIMAVCAELATKFRFFPA